VNNYSIEKILDIVIYNYILLDIMRYSWKLLYIII